jgi:tetratricopeptide (TPR) repeat protein
VTLVAEHVRSEVQNVPVDRLIASLTGQLKERPRDLEVRVNLARVYAMAYAQKADQILVRGKEPSQWAPAFTTDIDIAYQQFEVKAATDAKVRTAAKANLTRAIAEYRAALLQDPNHIVSLIGLGWCLVQAGEKSDAIAVLRRAAEAAWQVESGPKASVYASAPSMVAEASRYLTPLLDVRRDTKEILQLRERVKTVDELPRWITPIVIPLQDRLTALELVDDDAHVVFDLDGTGPKRWRWITPSAAWLVYDHFDTGRITSGLQLFGNVTFWAFWQNGYHALRALDDDGDGEVRGAELRGLALWHDRNANGISDRGEVRPVMAWGIEALSTGYTFDSTHPDEIPWSSAGVRFADGTVRPTFDVVLARSSLASIRSRCSSDMCRS